MIRATVIAGVRAYLASAYEGPIAIHPETSVETMAPPYAVVRVGTAEQLYPEQAEVWDMNILIGVFHDADVTTPDQAEANAAELFAIFADPASLFDATEETLVWSALERLGTDASIVESRWQHVAAFRGIVAPAAD